MAQVPKSLGKYRIVGAVGRGGMGEVWKAFQPDLNRHVAIKTMLSGEQASEEFLLRFQREARTAAKLSHPNIVQIHDIGAEGTLHFIVMEYVEGRSLRELLSERKLDPEKALRIAYTVARALQFAHRQGIIHRDIKPANVLIDKQGRVRILDFGLAKSLADGKALTGTSVMVGTPYYMSPEQAFAAPEEVDERTDLYSLGAVLYEMLTGHPPFDGATVLAILRKIEEEEPEPPGISPAVDPVVLRALAKDPARRFQNAGEMAEAIKACLSNPAADPGALAPVTTRATLGGPPPGLTISRRGLWAAGALAVAAALGILAWAAWPRDEPPRESPGASPSARVRPADPAARLRGLLERTSDPAPEELAPFREDPLLRRTLAETFLRRGQYSRAIEYLRGYERAFYTLASVRGLQRFVSPALFKISIPQPNPGDLQGPEAFLMAALARHLEGKQDAARKKLKDAQNAGAVSSHVLLLRAHVDLWDIIPNPGGERQKPMLSILRRELERSDEPYILALRSIAAQLDGDERGARLVAEDLLGRRAPQSAEKFMLDALLFQNQRDPDHPELRGQGIEMALDELPVVERLGRQTVDVSIQQAYLRWLEVLNDPEHEKLDVDPDAKKMDEKRMREVLDDRLKNDHYPAALFLRAVLDALESRWDDAQEDLRKLRRRTDLGHIVVGHERLAAFVTAGTARSYLLESARDLQWYLGRRETALATAGSITGEDLPDEERGGVLRGNQRFYAIASLGDETKALGHLGEMLKMGALPRDLRQDEELGALREKPAFQELLKTYRENHRQAAKAALDDEKSALENLEEALKLGVTAKELREDEELGEFRQKPAFLDLLKKYESR